MADSPAFASTPRCETAAVSAANTNRDGTGTIVAIATGAATGTKIEEVDVKATVTTTAGMVRLYLSLDAGTTWRLYDEIPVTAITASASVATFRQANTYTNLILRDASAKLGASTHNAEALTVVATGGDF
jgi:hypothetical protein